MHIRVRCIGAADEYGCMDDNDYDFVDRLQVQEEDGSWQTATIHRHKTNGGVCLFFGGSDYEGLPHTYSFIDGVLKDQDGVVIVTRAIESDSGAAVNAVDNADDTIDLLGDVPDHESDMYLRKGLTPDFIKDELQEHLDQNK